MFKKREKAHDCRKYLTPALDVEAGFRERCSGCGEINVRYDYFDDDMYGNTAEFAGWQKTGRIVFQEELDMRQDLEALANLWLVRDTSRGLFTQYISKESARRRDELLEILKRTRW